MEFSSLSKFFVITRQMLRIFSGEIWGDRIEKMVRRELGDGPLRVEQLPNGDYAYSRARCKYDPVKLLGQPIGQFHCPECGEMQIAGIPHLPPEDEWDDEVPYND